MNLVMASKGSLNDLSDMGEPKYKKREKVRKSTKKRGAGDEVRTFLIEIY